MPKEITGYTNSVERTIDILEYMATRSLGTSVAEISSRFEINRTSVYSIVKVLIKKGYVTKNASGKFILTGRMYEYGQKFKNGFPVVHAAKRVSTNFFPDYMCQLNIAMYFGGERAIILSGIQISSHFSADRINDGQPVPLYSTAIGKVLLAFMPPAASNELLNSMKLESLTANTITDFAVLKEQLHRAVEDGYAVEDEEFMPGSFCVAAPIFNADNELVAACSLSCNKYYRPPEISLVIKDVQFLARQISLELSAYS